MPTRRSVPGATRAIASSSLALRRGSSSEGVRVKPRSTALPSRLSLLLLVVATNAHPDRSPECVGLLDPKFAMARSALRSDDGSEPQLRALLEPPLGLGGGPETSRQPHLPERNRPLTDAHSLGCGRDRERDREVCAGLVYPHSAGDVDEHVRGAERDARVPGKH